MVCPRCSSPTRHLADYGPNQCRRCPLCLAFVVGPRGATVADSITIKRPVLGRVTVTLSHA